MFSISIFDDVNLENNETFLVTITAPDHIQLEITVTQIAIKIYDDEGTYGWLKRLVIVTEILFRGNVWI